MNLMQRLTLLSFSMISNVPSFHRVVPRSMLLKRILTAPLLESFSIVAAIGVFGQDAVSKVVVFAPRVGNQDSQAPT